MGGELVNCKCCDAQISRKAHVCPHCGEPSPVPAPPPPPPSLGGVLQLMGLDRATLIAALIVFLGIGVATLSYRAYAERMKVRRLQEQADREKTQRDEAFWRSLPGVNRDFSAVTPADPALSPAPQP